MKQKSEDEVTKDNYKDLGYLKIRARERFIALSREKHTGNIVLRSSFV